MKYIFILISICLLIGCNEVTVSEPGEMSNITRQMQFKETPQPRINVAAFNREPNEWGENVTGVKNRFVTDKKEIALTFDLCGGEFGNGYDEALVAFLREAEVPATLFVNERWIVENEKKRELEREGKQWVAEGIISEGQLQQILQRKQRKNPSFILILFAVLLTSLGFFTFIMSEWAQEQRLLIVLLIIVLTAFLYLLGDTFYKKTEDIFGMSLIVLGFIAFGAGLLLIIDLYDVMVYSAWPFIIWTLVGLTLYYIYRHRLLFAAAILVATIGQMYTGFSFFESSVLLMTAFLLGFGYFVYTEKDELLSYLFAFSYAVQMFVLTNVLFDQYYWFIVLILPVYIASVMVRQEELKRPFRLAGLTAIFIFGMIHTFMLQSEWFLSDIDFEWNFLVVWFILFIVGAALNWRNKQKKELVELLLFLPVMFLPLPYLTSLIILFIFSLGVIFIGNQKEDNMYILFGTVTFLLSTFTAFVQFAWDALNRSLFFFIGGLLLFLLSFLFEKQRRKLAGEKKGSGLE